MQTSVAPAKWAKGFAALAVAICGISIIATSRAHAEESTTMKVSAVAPTSGATVSGKTVLRAAVSGAQPTDYELYWSVDNGSWNDMQPDPNNPQAGYATIDLRGWKWRADNTYTITFSARLKDGGKTVQAQTRLIVAPNAAIKQEQPLLPKLFLNPSGQVLQQARAWGQAHPEDAPRMERLANQPMVEWYGNWNNDVRHDVDAYVSAATAAGALPAFVTYNIPQRDCGGWSAGGANDPDAYRRWIQAVADGLGERKALVIVEPDALAGMDCLSDKDKQTRLQLLHETVRLLNVKTAANIYLDAGNAHWQTAETMANRLKKANIEEATGFSLNVSNFMTTKASTDYGISIAKRIANKHFVIDTSRNGKGPTADYQWCNPTGRALGELPTTQTGQSFVDAYLWVKGPGGSDGSCGEDQYGTKAPRAGEWWPQYAKSLMEHAGW